MTRPSLLVIEDDEDIVELLRHNLEREGFQVWTAPSGEAGLDLAQTRLPSLILLDLGLPGIQGLEVCRMLRSSRETSRIPIVMLTAKGEESDIVVGLELGADDYVGKPFKVRELLARLRAVLRRVGETAGTGAESSEGGPIRVGPLKVDSLRHEVRLGEEAVELTRAEFRLLRCLASNPGRVLTRDRLIDEITEGSAFIIDRNVDVHVRAIRRKLGSAGEMIATVRGVGYKLRER
jgi:DNA-binding response OmpR family regulator